MNNENKITECTYPHQNTINVATSHFWVDQVHNQPGDHVPQLLKRRTTNHRIQVNPVAAKVN